MAKLNSEVQMRYTSAAAAVRSRRTTLNERVGSRDQLLKSQAEEGEIHAQKKADALNTSEGQQFVLSEITRLRTDAIRLIEQTATAALERVYGPGNALRFTTNEGKRQEGKTTSSTMTLNHVSTYRGQELVTGLLGEIGGGAIEAIGFALRIAFLGVTGCDYLLLDEAYAGVSQDGKLKRLTEFLQETYEQTGGQVIFVTHNGHALADVASRIILVEKSDDGPAMVRLIDKSEIPALAD